MPLIEKVKTDPPLSNGTSNAFNGDDDLVEPEDQFGLIDKTTKNNKQVIHFIVLICRRVTKVKLFYICY